ncbi:MAG: polyisoprenyl-phosphate glycosyltransferase [Gaiellales bacterium]|jgi:dolichol-phosphate mannosyltransferase|nr:polyisoprenyl-phosphate glycosyltransferase [Gaiellales bacterium]
MRLSVVVPVHNEVEVLPHFLERLLPVLEGLDGDWEIIFVEDSSTDGTWEMLREMTAGDERLRALRLSRSFGHQGALTAGMWAAEGDRVVTMDGDLQHPPETVPDLLARIDEGFDVVYAVRSPIDSESRFTVLRAHAFYWTLNRLARLDLPHGVADFRCMSRPVVNALVSMPERSRFLRGMTRWVGFRQTVVEYDRAPRAAGQSKYTLGPMFRLAIDAVISFSTVPLRLASILGLVVSLIGVAYGALTAIQRLTGDVAVAGYTSLLVAVLILGGVQLACLGIIGQYLGRVYDESKGRPLFLVWEDTRQSRVDEPALMAAGVRVGEQPRRHGVRGPSSS